MMRYESTTDPAKIEALPNFPVFTVEDSGIGMAKYAHAHTRTHTHTHTHAAFHRHIIVTHNEAYKAGLMICC